MEAIFNFLIVAVIAILMATIVGGLKPAVFQRSLKKHANRKSIILGGVASLVLVSGLAGAVEPAHLKQARLDKEKAVAEQHLQTEREERAQREKTKKEVRNKITTEEERKSESIAFGEETRTDGSLPQGHIKVIQEGTVGEKLITYKVIYKGGVEQSRELTEEKIVKKPVSKVTAIGTYVTPPKATGGHGYTNSAGNHVRSPSADPAGATAKCRDGTYSYSQSRPGTCSHHGGVAIWL